MYLVERGAGFVVSLFCLALSKGQSIALVFLFLALMGIYIYCRRYNSVWAATVRQYWASSAENIIQIFWTSLLANSVTGDLWSFFHYITREAYAGKKDASSIVFSRNVYILNASKVFSFMMGLLRNCLQLNLWINYIFFSNFDQYLRIIYQTSIILVWLAPWVAFWGIPKGVSSTFSFYSVEWTDINAEVLN